MRHSRTIPEARIFTTGFGKIGFKTVEAPLQAQQRQKSDAGQVKPSASFQPVSERFPTLEKQEIFLTLAAPEATEVNVAGNFNDWRSDATRLKNTGDGRWVVRLMLRSGQYEYRFVVDGLWREDPAAVQRVANPNGGFNSVLIVPLEFRTSLL
jgi:1,4-alpha-glucan branching enzyme